ncbi:hypothetical protein GCM10010922_05390 [Microbacterium sorbitolivorans]|uniref:Aldo/keto reductase n=1 Tax=Microbacterium sorbitolivorans TaxID=1867410 RepID=A0A367Y8F0_9MICO|nr:aldo/keto reductase [Microbacterium sorbitolivorans]RCK61322.1 aldo/keto reductase [Microbacterium sorbitolivorans]GGF33183.1 hypothetical protein GCM10010922_05390 [Microbacterium sorbitolivorans]
MGAFATADYGNERGVGEGGKRSGLARDDVFVETKVWTVDHGYEQSLHAFDKSAAKLGIDQIDLLILHQACPKSFDKTIGAYRALENLHADNTVRTIGVSILLPHLGRPGARDVRGSGLLVPAPRRTKKVPIRCFQRIGTFCGAPPGT